MKKEYFEIFSACFPEYEMTQKRFFDLMHKDSCLYYEIKEDDEICAFAIVEDFAIRLLCVTPSKQGRGIGTRLIEQIEKEAKDRGFDKLITGGVSSKLFIGAPSESWRFFEKRGFVSEGGCDEMILDLNDFEFEKLSLHGSDIADYGWFDGDMKDIKAAVSLVDESWTQYFTKPENIYVGKVQGEIASFCMVDTNCQNYLTDKYGKVGMPGCVGTVPKFRDKGIALEMVARATRYLKTQGMDVSFIYYTGVPKWYEKIGYRTFLTECFGTKHL
ncbi:MAG: GNAT family N-acetyltransferase [Butyrivibrio sp.]|nr:GNAT family N-acetyltransferase [Butyrivibrio sp.]